MLLSKPSTFLAVCSIIMLSLLLSDDPHNCQDISKGFSSMKHHISQLLATEKESLQRHLPQQLLKSQGLSTSFYTGKTQLLTHQTPTATPERNLPTSFPVLNQNTDKPDLSAKFRSKSKVISLRQKSHKKEPVAVLPSATTEMTPSAEKRLKPIIIRKPTQLERDSHFKLSAKRKLKKMNEYQKRKKFRKDFVLNLANQRQDDGQIRGMKNENNNPKVLANSKVSWKIDLNKKTELKHGQTQKPNYTDDWLKTWFHSCTRCSLGRNSNIKQPVSDQDSLKKVEFTHLLSDFNYYFYPTTSPKNAHHPKGLIKETRDSDAEISPHDTLQQHFLVSRKDVCCTKNYTLKILNSLTAIEDMRPQENKMVSTTNFDRTSAATNEPYLSTTGIGGKIPQKQSDSHKFISSNTSLPLLHVLRNKRWRLKVPKENIPLKTFQDDAQLISGNGKSFVQTQTDLQDKKSYPQSINQLWLGRTASTNEKHPGSFSGTLSKQITVSEFSRMKSLIKTTPRKDESLMKATKAWYENYLFNRRKTLGDETLPSDAGKSADKTVLSSRNDILFGGQTWKKIPSNINSGRSLAPQRRKHLTEASPATMAQLNALGIKSILHRQSDLVEQRKGDSALLSLNENVHKDRIKRMVPLKEKVSPDKFFSAKKPPVKLVPTFQPNVDNKDQNIYETKIPNVLNENFSHGRRVVNSNVSHNINSDTDNNLNNVSLGIHSDVESSEQKENFKNESFVKLRNSTRTKADTEYAKNKTVSTSEWDINNPEGREITYNYTDINYVNQPLEGTVRNGSFDKERIGAIPFPGELGTPTKTTNTRNYTEKPTTNLDHFNVSPLKGSNFSKEIQRNITFIDSDNDKAFPSERKDFDQSDSGSGFETGIENNFTVTPSVPELNESYIADSSLNSNTSFRSRISNESNGDYGSTSLAGTENLNNSYYPLSTVGNSNTKVNKNLDESFTVSSSGSNTTYIKDEVHKTPEEVTTELYDIYDVTSQVTEEIRTNSYEGRDDELRIPNEGRHPQNKNESNTGIFPGLGSVSSTELTPQEKDTSIQLNETVQGFESQNQTANGTSITRVYSNETVTRTIENTWNSTDLVTANTFESISSRHPQNKNESNTGIYPGFGSVSSTELTPQEKDTSIQLNETVQGFESQNQTANGTSITRVYSNETVTRTIENTWNSTDLVTANTFESISSTIRSKTEHDHSSTQLSFSKGNPSPTLFGDGNDLSYATKEPRNLLEGENTPVDTENYGNRDYTKATYTPTTSTDLNQLLETLPAADTTASNREEFFSTIKTEGMRVTDVEEIVTKEYVTQSTHYSVVTLAAEDDKSTVSLHNATFDGVESHWKPSKGYDLDTNTTLTPNLFTTEKFNNTHYINTEDHGNTANINPSNSETTFEQSFPQTVTEAVSSVISENSSHGTTGVSATALYEDNTTRGKINEGQYFSNSVTTTSLGIDRDVSLETDYEGSVENENGILNNTDKEHRLKRDRNSKEDSIEISPSQPGNDLIPKVEINSDWNLDKSGGSDTKDLNPVTVVNVEETILPPREEEVVEPTETGERTNILNNSNTLLANISSDQSEITTVGVPISGIDPLGDVSADTDIRLNLTGFPTIMPNKGTSSSFASEEDVPPTGGALDNSGGITKVTPDGTFKDHQVTTLETDIESPDVTFTTIKDPQMTTLETNIEPQDVTFTTSKDPQVTTLETDIEPPDATFTTSSHLSNADDVSEFPGERRTTTSIDGIGNENQFSTAATDKIPEKTQEVTEPANSLSTSGTVSDSYEDVTSFTTNDPVDIDSYSSSTVVTIGTDKSSSTLVLMTVPRETTRMSTTDSRSNSASESSTSSTIKTSSSSLSSENINSHLEERSSSTRRSVVTALETSTMVSLIPFHFTIDADYDKVVGNRKEEFQDSLKTQLAKVMRLPHDCITDLQVTRGSVDVSFNLVPDPSYGHIADEEAIKAAADELKRKIDNGELSLADLDGGTLVIVPIDPPSTPPPVLEKEHTTLILGVVIGLFIVTVITAAIIAVVVKNKSLGGRRLSPIEEARSKLPSYREIPFQEALYVKGNGRGLHQGKYCYDSGRWLGPGPEPQTAAPNAVAYRPPTDLQIRNTPRPSSIVRARLRNNWDLDWDTIMPDR